MKLVYAKSCATCKNVYDFVDGGGRCDLIERHVGCAFFSHDVGGETVCEEHELRSELKKANEEEEKDTEIHVY